MDGVTALAHLKSEARTAAIPVIALTAFAMKDDRARLLGAGFDDYIVKPISIKELLDQVQQFLEQAD
jgi:CheY-like chemotaxis protein